MSETQEVAASIWDKMSKEDRLLLRSGVQSWGVICVNAYMRGESMAVRERVAIDIVRIAMTVAEQNSKS